MDQATGWCRGCYRTIEEIMVWAQSSDDTKTAVWRELLARHRRVGFAAARHNRLLLEACEQECP